MYFHIYKIVNQVNGKIYISKIKNSKSNLEFKDIRINNDLLKNDIKRYGKDKFKLEILDTFKDRKSCNEYLNFKVDKDFRKNKNTYNKESIKKNIKIKDKDGNIFSVSKDDPRYLNGELQKNNKGKVIVKDEEGNTFKVSNDDSRYLSGELTHINKGKIVVRDEEGNTFKVSSDDPRYLNGELKGVQNNKVCVTDLYGNTFSVSKDDPRYLSGELTHINKGKFNVIDSNKVLRKITTKEFYKNYNSYNSFSKNKVSIKDLYGNTFSVSNNDPRYLSGELTHINKGKIVVRDEEGNTFKVSNDDPRYLNGELESIHKNKVNITNGKNIKKAYKNDIPSGYKIFSNTDTKKTSLTKKKNKEKKLKEKFNLDISVLDDNYYLIKQYCKHGDIIISETEFNKNVKNSLNGDYIFCDKCKKEILNKSYFKKYNKKENSYKNILTDIIDKKSSKNSYIFNKTYLQKYNTKMYRSILDSTLDIEKLYEKIYIYAKDITPKKCKIKNCNKKTFFSVQNKKYNNYCVDHLKYNFSSFPENEIYDFIKNNYNGEIYQNYRGIENKELDVFILDKKIGIEFNGLYWHGDNVKHNKLYHYNKYIFFKSKGINLITIWEDDWNLKKDIIKSILLNKLNLNKSIFARKCTIKEITLNQEKKFLNENHLQGWTSSSIKIGLFKDDELVSLMSFGKRNIGKKTQFEMIRFCNKKYISVIGGASKLFKYFISNFKHNNIISYANVDISDGNLYRKLGFNDIGHSKINYWWAKDKRYSRNKFMKHHLVKKGYDENKTEDEIMREKGFWKIFGNGNLKFEYKLR